MEELKDLYNFLLAHNHISKKVDYDTFASKFKDDAGVMEVYNSLASIPVQGSQYGRAGMPGNEFLSRYKLSQTPPPATPLAPAAAAQGSSAAPVDPFDPMKAIEAPAYQKISGLEDPLQFGKILDARYAKDPELHRYKTIVPGGAMAQARQELDAIQRYATEATKQAEQSRDRLDQKYPSWRKFAAGEQVDPAVAEQIQKDPDYLDFQSGTRAIENARNKFNETINAGSYRAAERAAAGQKVDTESWYKRDPVLAGAYMNLTNKGFKLPAALLSWNASVQSAGGRMGQAIGVSPVGALFAWGVDNITGLKTEKSNRAAADAIESFVDENFPRPDAVSSEILEDTVVFEGFKVVVRDGKPAAIVQPSGARTEPSADFKKRFEQAGAAKSARTAISTSSLLGATYDSALDLLLMRGMGGGTKIGTMATATLMGNKQAYDEAVQAGMSAEDAAQFALIKSTAMGGIEAYVGGIESKIFTSPAMKVAKKFGARQAATVAGKGGARAALNYVAPVVKEVLAENAEEVMSMLSSDAINMAFNASTGSKLDLETSKKSLGETMLVTTLLTAPMAAFGLGGHRTSVRRAALMSGIADTDRARQVFDEAVAAGSIGRTEADKAMARLQYVAQNLPQGLNQSDASAVAAGYDYLFEVAYNAGEDSPEFKKAQEEVDAYVQEIRSRSNARAAGVAPTPVVETATAPEGQSLSPQDQAINDAVDAAAEDVPQAPVGTPIMEAPVDEVATPAPVTIQEAIAQAPQEEGGMPPARRVFDTTVEQAMQIMRDKGFEPQEGDRQVVERQVDAAMQNPGTPVVIAADDAANRAIVEQHAEDVALSFGGDDPESIIARKLIAGDRLSPDARESMPPVDDRYYADGGAGILEFATDVAKDAGISIEEAIDAMDAFWTARPQMVFTDIPARQVEAEQRTAQVVSAIGEGTAADLDWLLSQYSPEAGVEILNGNRTDENTQVFEERHPGVLEQINQSIDEPVSSAEGSAQDGQGAQTAGPQDQAGAEPPLAPTQQAIQGAEAAATGQAPLRAGDLGAAAGLPGAGQDAGSPNEPARIVAEITPEIAEDIEAKQMNAEAETVSATHEVKPIPVQVVRGPDGSFIVTAPAVLRPALREIGARWIANVGWQVPASRSGDLQRVLSEHSGADAPKIGDAAQYRLRQLMLSPLAIAKRARRRARIAAATTLEGRIQAAMAETDLAGKKYAQRKRAIVAALQNAVPGVTFVTDPSQIRAEAERMGLPEMPFGFRVDNTVFLDTERMIPDTPIHEVGHIWLDVMERVAPQELQTGLDLVEGSEYEAAINEDPRYAALGEMERKKEALALAIGEEGARIMDSDTWVSFRNFLDRVWDNAKRLLGFSPRHMTIEQFAAKAAGDIFSEEFNRVLAQDASMKDDAAMMANRMMEAGAIPYTIFWTTGWRVNDAGVWEYRPQDRPAPVFNRVPATIEEPVNIRDLIEGPWDEIPGMANFTVSLKGNSPAGDMLITARTSARSATDAALAAAMARSRAKAVPGSRNTLGLNSDTPELPGYGADFHWGVTDARNEAAKSAIADIIDIELRNGTPRQTVIDALDGRWPVDRADIEAQWDAAQDRFKRSTTLFDPKYGKWMMKGESFLTAAAKVVQKWVSYRGLLPREVYKAEQERRRKVAAAMEEMKFATWSMEAAIKSEYGKATADQRREIYYAIQGGDISALPPAIAAAAIRYRDMIDSTTEAMLRAGAFQKGSVLKVMENMGLVLDPGDPNDQIAEALATIPFRRTDAQNELIDDFLATSSRQLGTYLNRSYRLHTYPDWHKIIPQETLDSAKRNMLQQLNAEAKEIEQGLLELEGELEKRKARAEKMMADASDVANQQLQEAQDELATRQLRLMDKEAKGNLSDKYRARLEKEIASAQKNVTDKQLILDQVLYFQSLDPASAEYADVVIAEGDMTGKGAVRLARTFARRAYYLERDLDKIRAKGQQRLDLINEKMANVQNLIDQIIAPAGVDTWMQGGRTIGAKDMGVLKRRKEIDKSIRELMGEYEDATVAFARSMFRMSSVLHTQEMANDLRRKYTGVMFFDRPTQSMGAYEQLSAQGNAALRPLDGVYTTPEIAEAMREFYSPETMSAWQNWWVNRVVSAVKIGKTAFSPVTVARNFFGNTPFAIQHGWNPATIAKEWSEISTMLASKYGYEERAKLIELGVLGESVHAEDMMALVKHVDQAFLSGIERVANLEKYTGENISEKVIGGVMDFYQAGDSFWRLLGYYAERNRYARALYKSEYNDLSDARKKEVEERAARTINMVLPTPSYAPRAIKWLRTFPMVGTFVTFPAEMLRVTYNSFAIIAEEMKDRRTAPMAIRRSLGLGLAIGGSYAIQQAMIALMGYTWEEWENMNNFAPKFQQDAQLIPISPLGEDGKVRYVNISYSDPYGFVKQAFDAAMDDDRKGLADRWSAAMMKVLEPFASPELTFNTVEQLRLNTDDAGNDIRITALKDPYFDSQWMHPENIRRQFKFAARKLQPGIVKSVWDLQDLGAFTDPAEMFKEGRMAVSPDNRGSVKTFSDFALAHTLGLQPVTYYPADAYKFQMQGQSRAKQDIRKIFTGEQRAANRTWENLVRAGADKNSLAKQEANSVANLQRAYKVAQDGYVLMMADVEKRTREIIGITKRPDLAVATLKEQGFSAEEIAAIMSGRTKELFLKFPPQEGGKF